MSSNPHFPPTLDINTSSPAPSVHSPLDITADIHPPFFQLLAIAYGGCFTIARTVAIAISLSLGFTKTWEEPI